MSKREEKFGGGCEAIIKGIKGGTLMRWANDAGGATKRAPESPGLLDANKVRKG